MLTIQLPTSTGIEPYTLTGLHAPHRRANLAFNRTVFAAAHVVADPLRQHDPWDGVPAIDWDATLRFREHLWALGFAVAEAMDTAQRGMGLDWAIARELIQRSTRHAKTIPGARIACGVGTDQLPPATHVTLAQVQRAYLEQLEVVEREAGQAIVMASRALARCARTPQDYMDTYTRVIGQASKPVILHWLGDMFDPALSGYWGSSSLEDACETVLHILHANASKVDGIKMSLLDPKWELWMRARLPVGVKMYTGDDFHYADLMAGDTNGYSDGLLGIFDAIAPVASAALAELAAGRPRAFKQLLDPTVALSREIFKAPTQHYKAGVVFLAWLNGHQSHFNMVAGLQSARDVMHYTRVFKLADQCAALQDPEFAVARMQSFLTINVGLTTPNPIIYDGPAALHI